MARMEVLVAINRSLSLPLRHWLEGEVDPKVEFRLEIQPKLKDPSPNPIIEPTPEIVLEDLPPQQPMGYDSPVPTWIIYSLVMHDALMKVLGLPGS